MYSLQPPEQNPGKFTKPGPGGVGISLLGWPAQGASPPSSLESPGPRTVQVKPGKSLRYSLSITPTPSLGFHSTKIWFCSKLATSESSPHHLQKGLLVEKEGGAGVPEEICQVLGGPFWDSWSFHNSLNKIISKYMDHLLLCSPSCL